MKILFYVELHPIRNELTHHQGILLSKWGDMISTWSQMGYSDVEYKIACNQHLYSILVENKPNLIPHIISTNHHEETELLKNLLPWESEGISLWEKLMRGDEDERLAIYYQYLSRVKKYIFDFDVIALWGMNKSVTKWASELNAVTFNMELASMRPPFPPSLYMDPSGVNGDSIASDLSYKYIEDHSQGLLSIDDILEKSVDDPLKDNYVLDSKYNWSKETYYLKLIRKELVLVPLQIADDSNVIVSSRYSNVTEFCNEVINAFKNDDKYHLIFKPHPGAIRRGGMVYKDHRNARQLIQKAKNATWFEHAVEKDSYVSFLRCFSAIVTINSSVGFEGMIMGLPVFALGEAIYKPSGISYLSSEIPGLLNTSNDLIRNQSSTIAKFLLNTVFFPEIENRGKPTRFINKLKIIIDHNKTDHGPEYYFDRILHTNDLINWN